MDERGREERGSLIRNEVAAEFSRRHFLIGGGLALGALVAYATPAAARLPALNDVLAEPGLLDGTLQAYFDTVIPGRPATKTDLGKPIHPRAIAGVDPRPGGVEADALLLSQHPNVGFNLLAPAFQAELEALSLTRGGNFLSLDYEKRQSVCIAGLDFGNPSRVVFELAAAVPFIAFCAAPTQREATAQTACGFRVMGFPGTAPHGYPDHSYRRKLSSERTGDGNLP
jgi:hypothetical protein